MASVFPSRRCFRRALVAVETHHLGMEPWLAGIVLRAAQALDIPGAVVPSLQTSPAIRRQQAIASYTRVLERAPLRHRRFLPPAHAAAAAADCSAFLDALQAIATPLARCPTFLGEAFAAGLHPRKLTAYEKARAGERIEGAPLLDATRIYTPWPLAQFLARHTIGLWSFGHDALPSVFDPACGGGALLLAAYTEALARAPAHLVQDIAWQRALITSFCGLDLDPQAVAFASLAFHLLYATQTGGDPLDDDSFFIPQNLRVPRSQWVALGARTELASELSAAFKRLGKDGSLTSCGALAHRASLDPEGPLLRKAIGPAATALLCQHSIVLLNPPFLGYRRLAPSVMEAARKTSSVAGDDLSVAFVDLARERVAKEGRLGIVTPQTWLTGTGSLPLRKRFLQGCPEVTLSLGQRVFESAALLYVALVVWKNSLPSEHGTVRMGALPRGARVEGFSASSLRAWPLRTLQEHPSAPLLALTTPNLLTIARTPPLLRDMVVACDGLWTGSNARDIRCFWELGNELKNYHPLSARKGYARWFAADWLRIHKQQIDSLEHENPPSWEYARVAGGRLSGRLAPSGTQSLAGVVRLHIREGKMGALYSVGALLNARLGTAFLRTTTSGLNFNPGYCTALPLRIIACIAPWVEAIVDGLKEGAAGDPRSDRFQWAQGPTRGALLECITKQLVREDTLDERRLDYESRIDRALCEGFNITADDEAYLTQELGELASCYPRRALNAQQANEAFHGAPARRWHTQLPPLTLLEATARAARIHPQDLLAHAPAHPTRITARMALWLEAATLRTLGFVWPREKNTTGQSTSHALCVAPSLTLPKHFCGPTQVAETLAQRLSCTPLEIAFDVEHVFGCSLAKWLISSLGEAHKTRWRGTPSLLCLRRPSRNARLYVIFATASFGPESVRCLLHDTLPALVLDVPELREEAQELTYHLRSFCNQPVDRSLGIHPVLTRLRAAGLLGGHRAHRLLQGP